VVKLKKLKKTLKFSLRVVKYKLHRWFNFDEKKKYDYKRIKAYKNLHKNKRCFIIGTGPSLTIEDLEKLKDETCFASNSIVKCFDKTTWRPVYYGITDDFVYAECEEQILKADLPNVFLFNRIDAPHFSIPNNFEIPNRFIVLPEIRRDGFGNNVYSMVYNNATITGSLIQIAKYMGFKDVYLLGCDCNYVGKNRHFHDAQYAPKGDGADYVSRNYKHYNAFINAKKYADANKINIFNATRGGRLDMFPRVALDKVLNNGDDYNE